MKQTLCKLSLLLTASLFSATTFAQTALPYYTGFDNATEKAGWVEFRTGVATTFNWVVGASVNAVSAPNAISHDYPVGAASTDTTVDWYVSPGFNFPAGGKIDSFRINVFSMTGHSNPGDSLVVYLLKGSANPTLATAKIKLVDLTEMAINNDTMKDTGNFVIPATTGTAYIAFKYQATHDWFVPTIDNIHISKTASTGVAQMATAAGETYIYPNPAINSLKVVFGNNDLKDATIRICNTIGQIVHRENCSNVTDALDVNISDLPSGTYYLQIEINTGGMFYYKLIKM